MGGLAKKLAKAVLEEQGISFDINNDENDDKTFDVYYRNFRYHGVTFPGFFAEMETPYAEIDFHLIIDENELEKVTNFEIRPLPSN